MDELLDEMERILAEASSQNDRQEKEAFIRNLATHVEDNVESWISALALCSSVEGWAKMRRKHIARAVSMALTKMLERELL